MDVEYFHPLKGADGKRLSTANIIWADRDRGDSYYSYSRFAMRAGKFPANHPCAPFDGEGTIHGAQMGRSHILEQFRSRGYWASCFPEGDGITFKWWEDCPDCPDKTPHEVMRDIEECFGWTITNKGNYILDSREGIKYY